MFYFPHQRRQAAGLKSGSIVELSFYLTLFRSVTTFQGLVGVRVEEGKYKSLFRTLEFDTPGLE